MAKISNLAVTDHVTGDEYLPVVQQGATRRATLTSFRELIVPFLQYWYKGDRGDPGGNIMAIGLFADAKSVSVPIGADLVQTSGYARRGLGAARYSFDDGVNAAFVAANPRTAFVTSNGRGFRLCETAVDARHFGAIGDGQTDDTAAILAALDYAEARGDDVYLPQGDFVMTAENDTDCVFNGPGRVMVDDVQRTTYAEPRSRFVIGQEYLWAFHTAVSGNPPGTLIDIATSGDSTTRGAFGLGNLPVKYQLDQMLAGQLNRYGLTGPVIHNRGTSGQTTREWIGAPAAGRIVLDDDIAAFPNLSLYILRWGLNDGSFGPGYHDIEQYRADIWTALTRIRAWKGVDELSIILMTPNTTSETGYRDEAWHEEMARVLKHAARVFKCCFIDSYAIWRDGRAGVSLWLDTQGAGGSGIHPDHIFNHWISDCIGRVAFAPLSTIQIATNNFINESGNAIPTITASVPASAFLRGLSIYRTAPGGTFPLDGIIIITKSAEGVTRQENIGFYNPDIPRTSEVSQQTCTRYALDGGGWSEWRDNPILLTLGSGWSLFATDNLAPLFQKSVGNVVTFNARLKNTSAIAGSSLGRFPVGFRPPVNMRFLIHNAAATVVGVIEVQTDGNIAWVSGDNTDVVVNLSFVAAA